MEPTSSVCDGGSTPTTAESGTGVPWPRAHGAGITVALAFVLACNGSRSVRAPSGEGATPAAAAEALQPVPVLQWPAGMSDYALDDVVGLAATWSCSHEGSKMAADSLESTNARAVVEIRELPSMLVRGVLDVGACPTTGIFSAGDETLVLGTADGQLVVWDLANDGVRLRVDLGGGPVASVRFLDDTHVVATFAASPGGLAAGTVRVGLVDGNVLPTGSCGCGEFVGSTGDQGLLVLAGLRECGNVGEIMLLDPTTLRPVRALVHPTRRNAYDIGDVAFDSVEGVLTIEYGDGSAVEWRINDLWPRSAEEQPRSGAGEVPAALFNEIFNGGTTLVTDSFPACEMAAAFGAETTWESGPDSETWTSVASDGREIGWRTAHSGARLLEGGPVGDRPGDGLVASVDESGGVQVTDGESGVVVRSWPALAATVLLLHADPAGTPMGPRVAGVVEVDNPTGGWVNASTAWVVLWDARTDDPIVGPVMSRGRKGVRLQTLAGARYVLVEWVDRDEPRTRGFFVWDSEVGHHEEDEVNLMTGPPEIDWFATEDFMGRVFFSDDGSRLVVLDATIDLAQASAHWRSASAGEVLLAVAADGATIAIGNSYDDEEQVVVVGLYPELGLRVAGRLAHAEAVTAAAFSPSGDRLAACTERGNVVVWGVRDRTPRLEFAGLDGARCQGVLWNGPSDLAIASNDAVERWSVDGAARRTREDFLPDVGQVLKMAAGGSVVAGCRTWEGGCADSGCGGMDVTIARAEGNEVCHVPTSDCEEVYYTLAVSDDGSLIAVTEDTRDVSVQGAEPRS